jgi:hypothetical protein
MCFSAQASFIASGGLIVLGGASLAIAKKEDKILAAIPFIFGIQQGFEGIQWLSLNHGNASLFAGYAFLFFALIVWPIYIPSSVFMIDKKKRWVLRWFVAVGIAVALYFLGLSLTQTLLITKRNACINYSFGFPFEDLAITAYLVAVLEPLFISSIKMLRWFGIIVAASAVIAWLFFIFAFTSVWCFFAAAISSLFFGSIIARNKKQKQTAHVHKASLRSHMDTQSPIKK